MPGRMNEMATRSVVQILKGAWLLLLLVPMLYAGPVRIGQIDAQTDIGYYSAGADAIAGEGDWYLSNGTLCAVVSGVDHESGLSNKGGMLVDLGYCGRADDQWRSVTLIPGLSKARIIPATGIVASGDEQRGELVVGAPIRRVLGGGALPVERRSPRIAGHGYPRTAPGGGR